MSARNHPSLSLVAAEVARLETPVILILCVAAFFFTYRGAAAIEQNVDWLAKAGCVLLALAVGAGLYLMWRAVLGLVPLLPRIRQWLAAPVVALICFLAVGISSYFNFVGMVGPDAVLRHMEAILEQSSDGVSFARRGADEGLAGVTVLRLTHPKFKQLAEAEAKSGDTSGTSGGNGALASMLSQVATVMGSALQQVEQKIKTADALTTESEKHLAAMRQFLTDPDLSLAIKVQRFGTEAESLRLKLLQLSQLEAASIIRQAVKSAQEVVKPALSLNKAVADRQQAAISNLTDLLDKLNSLTQVSEKPERQQFLGKAFRSITVYTAALQHMMDFIPAALAVCLIDLLMLPVLLLKILVHAGDRELDVAKRYTLAEVREVLGAAAAMPTVSLSASSPPTPPIEVPLRRLTLVQTDDTTN